nr:GNAT family N-acetyltransferase [Luteimonas sp. BDR2-5]
MRPHQIGDFAAIHAMLSDPQVVRHIAPAPPPEEDVWNRLLRYIGHWQAFGYGIFAVTGRDSGRFLGGAGFADFHRGLGPDFDRSPEASWVFAREAQGRGIASEAATAMHAWFDAQPFGGRSVCIIDPDNAASRRLAARLGYVETGEVHYHAAPTLAFERLRGASPRT